MFQLLQWVLSPSILPISVWKNIYRGLQGHKNKAATEIFQMTNLYFIDIRVTYSFALDDSVLPTWLVVTVGICVYKLHLYGIRICTMLNDQYMTDDQLLYNYCVAQLFTCSSTGLCLRLWRAKLASKTRGVEQDSSSCLLSADGDRS